jgi:glycosyltransferase involved in cell wall biosynthesis
MSENIQYYAFINKKQSPGLVKKVNNTVSALKNLGYMSESKIYDKNFKSLRTFIKDLTFSRAEIIFIRFSDLVFPFLFFSLIYLRIKGKKIIVDVPTPRTTSLKEMELMINNPLKKNLRKLFSVIFGSWILTPANLIIQYAKESNYFNLFLENKSIKIGNSINIDDNIPFVNTSFNKTELNLIGVGQIAKWHGYDRILYALNETKKEKLSYKISFTIVGDGEELENLKKLTEKLKLEKEVKFTGFLVGEDLDKEFENKHIGVSSLGLFRKNLSEASDLKTREYLARGLSVITSGEDPDLEESLPFRFRVKNDNSIDEIVDCLKNVSLLANPLDIRNYASEKLTFEAKLKIVLEKLFK